MSKKVFFFNLLFNGLVAVLCFHDVIHTLRAFDVSPFEEWLAALDLIIGLLLTASVVNLIANHAKEVVVK